MIPVSVFGTAGISGIFGETSNLRTPPTSWCKAEAKLGDRNRRMVAIHWGGKVGLRTTHTVSMLGVASERPSNDSNGDRPWR
jgi:hypothetical protein